MIFSMLPMGIRNEMSEWISVKDRLPYLYDFVLVFADNKGTNEPRPVAIARLVHEYDVWELLGNLCVGAYHDIEYSMDRWEITHWMPLPPPPKTQNLHMDIMLSL